MTKTIKPWRQKLSVWFQEDIRHSMQHKMCCMIPAKALAILSVFISQAMAQPAGTRVIAVTGDAAPLAPGADPETFGSFALNDENLNPVLDDAGRVTFVATLSNPVGNVNGIYQSSPFDPPRLITRSDMEEATGFIDRMRASGSGHVCFSSNYTFGTGPSSSSSIVYSIKRWNPGGMIDDVITTQERYFKNVPPSAASLVEEEYYDPSQPWSVYKYFLPDWQMNGDGAVMATAAMRTVYYPPTPDQLLYPSEFKSKEWSGLVMVPKSGTPEFVFAGGHAKDSGQALDDAWQSLVWTSIDDVVIHDNGWMGFMGFLDPGGSVDMPAGFVDFGSAWYGLVKGNFSDTRPQSVVRHRQLIDNGNGEMFYNPIYDFSSGFAQLHSDDSGNITFLASVRKVNGDKEVRSFARSYAGGYVYEPMPRGLGISGLGKVEVDGWPDTGRWAGVRVVQKVKLTGGVQAILARTGAGAPQVIAVQNQPAPDSENFYQFKNISTNARGRVAFQAELTTYEQAIFFQTAKGELKRIVGTGDPFLDSSLAGIEMIRDALNERDEILFQFTLMDGRTGLAVGVVPPESPEITVEQGTGPGKKLKNNKSSRNFRKVKVGKSSKAMIFTIRNEGNVSLSQLQVTINGRQAKDFRISKKPAKSVAPGKTTAFKVVYQPKKAKPSKATLQISSNDVDETRFLVKLLGAGTK